MSTTQASVSVERSKSVPHGHGGAAHAAQQPFLQSENAKFLFPEIAALMKKVNELDRQYAERESKLRKDTEALEKHREDELRSIRETREKTEIEINSQWDIHTHRMKWDKDNLQKEKREFEDMKTRSVAASIRHEKVVLDVGGKSDFKTEMRTLTSNPESLLHEMAKLALENKQPGKDAKIFIDRDPKHFRLILNFLRQGKEVLQGADLRDADSPYLYEILCEAKFYQLKDLELLIERRMVALEKPIDFNSLCRSNGMARVSQPMGQPHPQAIKHATSKDLQLEKKNLTGIIFEQVHFKHPTSFKSSVLVGATFKQCVFDTAMNFTNADLTHAKFDRCQGLILSERFVLTGANTEETIFDPPLAIDED